MERANPDVAYVDEDGNEYGFEVEDMIDLPDRFEIDPSYLEQLLEAEQLSNQSQDASNTMWSEVPMEDDFVESVNVANGSKPLCNDAKGKAINVPEKTSNASSFVDLLFGGDIWKTLVRESNAFAPGTASKLTINELKQYFALTLYMCIVNYPTRKMYWENSHYGDVWVKSVMPRERFFEITNILRWKDTTRLSEQARVDNNAQDGFWMIADLLDILAKRFMQFYQCGRYISIAETNITFNGRHRLKCAHPQLLNKYYFKVFCLHDAETGYLSNFHFYRGKSDEGTAYRLQAVSQLTEPACYHSKKHVLSLPAGFASVESMILCKSEPRSIDAVGPTSPWKQGLNNDALVLSLKNSPRRAIRVWQQCINEEKTLAIYQTSWLETHPVHFLSTFNDGLQLVGSYDVNERGVAEEISAYRPVVIEVHSTSFRNIGDHNEHTYFDTRFPTDDSQRAFIYRCFRIAVTNAHVLFQNVAPGMQDISLMSFMRMVISEWTNTADPIPRHLHGNDTNAFNDEVCIGSSSSKRTRSGWKKAFKDRNYFSGGHFPAHCQKVQLRKPDGTPGVDERKECKLCSKRIMILCEKCNVFLCIGESGKQSCFKTFHTQSKL